MVKMKLVGTDGNLIAYAVSQEIPRVGDTIGGTSEVVSVDHSTKLIEVEGYNMLRLKPIVKVKKLKAMPEESDPDVDQS